MRKISAIFIALTALALTACGGESTYYPETEPYIAAEIQEEVEVDLTEDTIEEIAEEIIEETIEEPVHHSFAITIMINETPVIFQAYEKYGELYFSLEELSIAFQDTQAFVSGFWYRDAHGHIINSIASEITTETINGRTHATLENVARVIDIGVDISAESGAIYIDTREPYISDTEQRAIVDFLLQNYPQLFTFEQIFEDLGPGYGWWFASMFSTFDIDGGTPGISIRFDDAGSWANRTYMFINGRYQLIGNTHFRALGQDGQGRIVWTRFNFEENTIENVALIDGSVQVVEIEDEEVLMPDARPLNALWRNVTDAANKQLWPYLEMLSGGITIDTRLDDDIIDLVMTFFDDQNLNFDIEWTVHEIKKSMILDGLVIANVTHNIYDRMGSRFHDNTSSRFWFNVCNYDGWQILGYLEDWWLWDREWWLQ